VMEYLASEAQAGRVERVLFLMPCHATPYYSSLHKNIPMRFLDCSPRYMIDSVSLSLRQQPTFKYMLTKYRL